MREKWLKQGKNAGLKRAEELYSVDFLRFIFAMIIVYFHIFHDNIMKFTNNSGFYKNLYENANGDVLVECFFLLSGFFMFYSFKKRGTQPRYRQWYGPRKNAAQLKLPFPVAASFSNSRT